MLSSPVVLCHAVPCCAACDRQHWQQIGWQPSSSSSNQDSVPDVSALLCVDLCCFVLCLTDCIRVAACIVCMYICVQGLCGYMCRGSAGCSLRQAQL
jgi:hypothetical protein